MLLSTVVHCCPLLTAVGRTQTQGVLKVAYRKIAAQGALDHEFRCCHAQVAAVPPRWPGNSMLVAYGPLLTVMLGV